jgi:hypothetical protein
MRRFNAGVTLPTHYVFWAAIDLEKNIHTLFS